MSKKIKIISNPYRKEIKYFDYNETNDSWEDIIINNPNSKLRESKSDKVFLPFKIKEILKNIIDEYYKKGEKIELLFEGTNDEYREVEELTNTTELKNKINLVKMPNSLENARIIFPDVRECFNEVETIIGNIIKDDEVIKKDLEKVSESLKDVIPICVFGNYSAGKSTFINALIGNEILPSGGDPVTAKVYKISRSKDEDVARISFKYEEIDYSIVLENNSYRFMKGDLEKSLIKIINDKTSKVENLSMATLTNSILETINNFEKEHKSEGLISNVIELETPFSKEGILGKSYNNYIIFDTPGSNSETNVDHKKVLEDALDKFSNGIPVWVSTYESIDSNDNASLCEKISGIDALDKRFTMIILNKADGSDLSEEEFTKEKQEEILNYNSISKMYSSGIYFVSSIMGLGSKNNGQLTDKHYRKTYRTQQEVYSDPSDEDYATLYKYNIMPTQIKNKAINYSENCKNLVYANSGLLCVEMEIENFASKYALYNKCQMVNRFLNRAVAETNQRIENKTDILNRAIVARTNELETDEKDLINNIQKEMASLRIELSKKSLIEIKTIADKKPDCYLDLIELEKIANNFDNVNEQEKNYTEQESKLKEAKNTMFSHMKFDVKQMFKEGFLDSMKMKLDNIKNDFVDYREKQQIVDELEKEVDSKTGDELIELITNKYKENTLVIRNYLLDSIKELWKNNMEILKNAMVKIVVGDEKLSQEQKNEISNVIANFETQKVEDDINDIFVKSKYLEGKIFGLRITDSEKVNVKKLTSSYNLEINKFTSSLSEQINKNCKESFMSWENDLELMIINNRTEYNPKLREKTDMINDDNERINELRISQEKISVAIDEIDNLMSWKESE